MATRTKVDGTRLRDRREELHLTVATVAKRIGCHEDSLRNIELGRRQPGVELFGRLLGVLGGTREDYLVKKRTRVKAGQ